MREMLPHFDQSSRAEGFAPIGLMNAFNRLAIGFRVPPKAALSDREAS